MNTAALDASIREVLRKHSLRLDVKLYVDPFDASRFMVILDAGDGGEAALDVLGVTVKEIEALPLVGSVHLNLGTSE